MRNSRGSGGFIATGDVVDAAGNPIPQAQNYMQMQVPGQYQQHHMNQQQQLQQQQQAQQNQPIYMNFAQIQQTTQAEVHCENPYENKVGLFINLYKFLKFRTVKHMMFSYLS